ncbi:hypothetical protein BO82DRAFT_400764 [Aspergillus uvarum CBS 121591]|uniref:Uncharacterized protein n=1 Tax=Aspergillus uvarum CBS 121591 TaxID=1448315 RepID=A0A319CCM6_9EURO|nr:hypothetical protein BO82DRAFT_400764 [Aspergillus uvarum CBS 121591]PYH83375.1 hypothetical protein BO82DRAFT_400764 [Aspergillus uvarum CBS 121591]
MVASHVPAKRNLTATRPEYPAALSSTSRLSLRFQGGPFRGEELAAFETHPLRDEMVALRLWDDAGKIPGIVDSTPRAGEYLAMIVEHSKEKQRRLY